MIIFDKIKKVLFTEVEEDDYVEEIIEEPTLEKIESNKKTVSKKEEKVVPIIEETVFESKKEVAKESAPFDIKVDVPTSEKKVGRRLRPIERKEFEIPQVISPINGIKEDMNQAHADYVPTVKPKNHKDSLGTVISPYYGDGELEAFHHQAQMEIHNEHIEKRNSEDDFVADDEIENVSLDQIVSAEVVNEDEMIQFSLFGDDVILKDIQEGETLKDTEKNDDDLPF